MSKCTPLLKRNGRWHNRIYIWFKRFHKDIKVNAVSWCNFGTVWTIATFRCINIFQCTWCVNNNRILILCTPLGCAVIISLHTHSVWQIICDAGPSLGEKILCPKSQEYLPPNLELLMEDLVSSGLRLVKNNPLPKMKVSGLMCRELVCGD